MYRERVEKGSKIEGVMEDAEHLVRLDKKTDIAVMS